MLWRGRIRKEMQQRWRAVAVGDREDEQNVTRGVRY